MVYAIKNSPVKKRGRPPKTEASQLIYNVHTHNINPATREIYLHGCESSGDEINHISSIPFIKNLHILDKMATGRIYVHMHIDGGNWHDGMAMMDAIFSLKSPVTIISYSLASSMSGVLLQAADKRVMMPNTYFMMHYGTIGMEESHSHSAAAYAEFNLKECDKMLNIFARRAMVGPYFQEKGYSQKQIARFFDKKMREKIDWYLTAEEAYKYGLCDEIYKTKEKKYE